MPRVKSSDIILSICIPTYNRAPCLARLLENISHELIGLEDCVEICVSDNASSDNTREVVETCASKLPIVYSRNERNLGYDQNAVKVVTLASGKYVWYIGDDDVLEKGSIKMIVEDIRHQLGSEVGAIFINAKVKGRSIVSFNFNSFKTFQNDYPPMHIGFGGCVCLNRKCALEVISKNLELRADQYFKKNLGDFVLLDFVHTYLFFECVRASNLVGVEPNCAVIIVADGEKIGIIRKVYLDLLIRKYILEIKKHYTDFRECYPWSGHLKALLSLNNIARKYPEFEPAYLSAYEMVVKILTIEKLPNQLALIKSIHKTRTLFGGKLLFGSIYSILRRVTKIQLGDYSENERLKSKINGIIAQTRELINF